MKHLLFTILIAAATIPIGCTSPTTASGTNEESAKKSYVEKQAVKVAVQKVRQDAFARELVSNGKLVALEKAVVPFAVQEQIAAVKVKNGDRVRQGDLLARVDAYEFQKQLNDARNQYENTRIDLEDQLLGYSDALS